MTSLNRSLTEKQGRFVREFLVDGNGARSAVAAGYGVAGSRVTACRLLTNPNVRAVLDERQQADADRLSMAREHVVAGFLEAARLAREQSNPGAMVAAWKELGKLCGFYPTRRTEIVIDTVKSDIPNRFEAMTDAELQALMDAATV